MVQVDRGTVYIAAATFLLVSTAAIVVTVQHTDIGETPDGEAATVTRVIDGDTVVVNGSRRVRLLGVDATEKGTPCFETGRTRLQTLVGNQSVTMTRDIQNRGRYDRLLRYLSVNGKDVNTALVRGGAVFARISPDVQRRRDALITAETTARKQDKGCVWQHTPHYPARETVSACTAAEHRGETVTVQGRVVDTGEETGTVFLNFGKPYPNSCFTAVIFRGARHRFPRSIRETYRNETVAVTGTVQRDGDAAEIVVRAPRQLHHGTD